MTTAPEIAYTDRNVREDPFLAAMAVDYLRRYGGSFEPLVNAQELLNKNGWLPTNIGRMVLNCMRFDTNVAANMPAPKQYSNDDDDLFETRKKKNRIAIGQCGSTDPHLEHWPTPTTKCPGIPWKINRYCYTRPATVKKPYVRAVSGRLFHYVNTTKDASYVQWFPNTHSYGFRDGFYPDLYVRTVCKTPGVLRNPILLDALPSLDTQELAAVYECHWCKDIIDTPIELR